MILAGVAVSAMLTAFSQGIALYFDVAQDIMFWTVGGVSASNWDQMIIMVPILSVGIILALMLSDKVSLLSFGEDVAKGLGLNTRSIYWLCSFLVVVLAGISVSIVGSIGFVGLVIPHMARYIVGVDYKRIVPATVVLGSLLMVGADLLSRTLNPPFETPLGALIAVLGVPYFLHLSRKERRAL